MLFGALQARNIVVGTPNFEVACQGLMTMLQLKLNQVPVVSRQERDDVLKELMASPLESRDRISLMDAVDEKAEFFELVEVVEVLKILEVLKIKS